MGRVAWEATKLEQHQMLEPQRKAKVLMKRDLEYLIVNELGVEREASETIDAIQMGLLLSMQAHLRAGAASQILFGHKSFREYLVARYWADRLKTIAQARQREWDDLEKPLLGGRLLSREDRTFDFLMQMLNGKPLPQHPHAPFGLDRRECDALLDWAQSRFDSEEQQDASGNRFATLRDDRRPWLREAVLAIGSSLHGSPGMRIKDKLSARSMLAWFWLMRIGPIIIAPKARWKGAMLSENTLRGANFRGADLEGAHITGTNFAPARVDVLPSDFTEAKLDGAMLMHVNLEQAHFERASLKNANLTDAHLAGAGFSEANLEGTLLKRASLAVARMKKARMRGADLTNAHLVLADLRHADLREAVLRKVDLTHTDLRGANLTEAQYDRNTVWPSGFDPVAAGAILVEETSPS